jgi:DNA-binding NarL/FixJ family response regulator
MNPINVWLADDHVLFTDGLKKLLLDYPNLVLEKDFSNGDDLTNALQYNQPDLIFCDLSMPGLNGIDLVKLIRKQYPKLKLVIVSMHETPDVILPIVREGVAAYVLKNTNKSELFTCVETILNNEQYFSKSIIQMLLNRMQKRTDSDFNITKREKEIIFLLEQGYSTKEMAEKLFLSAFTINTHRKNLLAKTGCKNALHLVQKAKEMGWC